MLEFSYLNKTKVGLYFNSIKLGLGTASQHENFQKTLEDEGPPHFLSRSDKEYRLSRCS